MNIDWSAWDGGLGILLVIVVIWAGLKLMKRLILALIALVLIGTVFFGMHWNDFLSRDPSPAAQTDLRL